MKKFIAVGLTCLLGLFVIVMGAAVVMAPSAAKGMVEERLARVEERTGLKITLDALDIHGLGEIEIKGLKFKDADVEVASVGVVTAQIDPMSVVMGERRTRALLVRDVDVHVVVDASGSLPLLDMLRGSNVPDEPSSSPAASGGLTSKLDLMPEAEFENVRVFFDVAQGGPRLPVSMVEAKAAAWSWDGETLQTNASVTLTPGPDERVKVPRSIDIKMGFDSALKPVSGALTLDGVFSIAGVGPLPFLKAEVEGMGISEDGTPFVSGIRVSTIQGTPVFEMKQLQFALGSLAELKNFRFGAITLEQPTLLVSFDAGGASIVGDIEASLIAPAASMVASTARGVAANFSAQRQKVALPVEDEDAETPEAPAEKGPTAQDRLAGWIDRIPGRIEIKDAAIKITDHRKLAVTRPAKNLMMRDGQFGIGVDKDSGEVSITGGFSATAEAAPRGSAKVDVKLQPVNRTISGDVDVDALDLSWTSQLLGRSMSDRVRGGTLRAKVKFDAKGPGAFDMDGLLSITDLTFFDARLAEEPLEGITASYSFNAAYDANLAMPEPKLMKVPVYKTDPDNPVKLPAPLGGLVFKKGQATVGDVSLTFRPSFFGFNAPRSLPARMDLTILLPKTPVMSLLKAVPAALMGAASQTKMEGFFEWNFNVEVPLYRAGDMEWRTEPKLSEFQIVSIPEEVDVRRLMDGMSVTIVDSIEEENDFTRTIKLKPAMPVPVEWMLENTGMTLEQIDERRRTRGWPELPTRYDGVREDVIDSPEVWETQWATRQQAARPWDDFSTVEAKPDLPYGPYVFVPIQYISPYLVRAVMTTEDNSFFQHSGFNTLALKESIERNLNSGQFKRGASTIAMQMIKNVFLNRKKVISRKLQEAFLVFLMESAVDVPKVRIMEIYLNVIEFGPGVFGIHEGALHYFGKRPDALTLGEVAWLVSIIPGPKKFHTYYERGAITPAYFSRMKRYIQAMYNRGRITEEELNEALLAPPEFYKPAPGEPVLKATQTEIPLFDAAPSLLPCCSRRSIPEAAIDIPGHCGIQGAPLNRR
ncbi:MAG: transglycosylase domain-containing protein [bacterium]